MNKGFDTFQTPAVVKNAARIKADGFGFVALYYFNHSGFKQLLTRPAATAISKAGLYIVSIWEDGQPTSGMYFSAEQGRDDGLSAHTRAAAAGQPGGTPIYATVDYDASDADLTRVTAYFKAFRDALVSQADKLGAHYTVGVYGSGMVCQHLSALGLVSHTWLSLSTGFPGYHDWHGKADLIQHGSPQYLGMDIDLDYSPNGSAGGWQVLG